MSRKESRDLSYEEHLRDVRRVWIRCGVLACLIFVGTTGGIALMAANRFGLAAIVLATTALFQVAVPPYGVGFVAPALLTSLMKVDYGLRMNREALEMGRKTADNIETLKEKLVDVVDNLQATVKDFREIVHQVRDQELGKVSAELDKFFRDGAIERTVKAIESIPGKIDELVRKVSSGEVDGDPVASKDEAVDDITRERSREGEAL